MSFNFDVGWISRKEIIAQILLELYTVAATSLIFALMLEAL